mmetsp:Transcript_60916/g.181488  ORF Transcript_60916/g.181488 Transcript_60916/m.181488 type:complete len:204 (-) Transcript_60916:406-1017(-)
MPIMMPSSPSSFSISSNCPVMCASMRFSPAAVTIPPPLLVVSTSSSAPFSPSSSSSSTSPERLSASSSSRSSALCFDSVCGEPSPTDLTLMSSFSASSPFLMSRSPPTLLICICSWKGAVSGSLSFILIHWCRREHLVWRLHSVSRIFCRLSIQVCTVPALGARPRRRRVEYMATFFSSKDLCPRRRLEYGLKTRGPLGANIL